MKVALFVALLLAAWAMFVLAASVHMSDQLDREVEQALTRASQP